MVRSIMLRKMIGENERLTIKSKVELSRLPPPRDNLVPHIQRVNHRVASYKRADQAVFWRPNPFEPGQGWERNDDGLLEPVWSCGPVLPTSLIDIVESTVGEEEDDEEDGPINFDEAFSDEDETLFVKAESASPYKVIFQIEIQNYKLWFHYQTSASNVSVVELTPLQSQSKDLKEFQWHVISVSVVNTDLSYYIDGTFIQGATLTGPIVDGGGLPRVGQTHSGGSQFEGFMQDIFMYDLAISNREIMEALTGNLEKAYIATNCRCPPGYPKISTSKPAKCAKNIENAEDEVFRLATTAHPSEYMTDADTTTYWQSAVTDNATVEVDLLYQELQIFFVIMVFYGPPPEAILIERSRDRGSTYEPWQYFASDCQSSFGMENNGNLVNPDSINCIQYQRPLPYSSATIAFKLERSIPARPFGAPCSNLYCSTRFLDFIKASNVRIQLYNHTLIQNEKHRYFALKRVLVTGRCECHGHAQKVTFIKGNSSSPGRCRCECDPSTFTQGEKCESCLPMYNNKAFLRGTNDDPYPCVKCECNNHATACYYNSSLDPSPASRTVGGGGVCINCLHNTAGQFCHVCRDDFFREPGKSLSAVDVCSPCQCTGPGVETGKTSCARVSSGNCTCKKYVREPTCGQCMKGYFNLSSSNPEGCQACNCNPKGTLGGDRTPAGELECSGSNGKCACLTNVQGLRCDKCVSAYYWNPSGYGCSPCNCDASGSLATNCNSTGYCQCKPNIGGRRCDRCMPGSYGSPGSCKPCNCNVAGVGAGLGVFLAVAIVIIVILLCFLKRRPPSPPPEPVRKPKSLDPSLQSLDLRTQSLNVSYQGLVFKNKDTDGAVGASSSHSYDEHRMDPLGKESGGDGEPGEEKQNDLLYENTEFQQVLQYLFRILDVQAAGFLNIFSLNYFFRIF
ncbi:predicted protein [Nematostella vectensis]|uniref:Uncharacterized protein n=1 Tax=Nematostella vectensis TaxID=45351 RepID=A7RNY2_NEMVE|nr:predicted protein [Nematostella vectensis]|eukprot:XP_001638822.1 predicted protein [Nematostella vectensis]